MKRLIASFILAFGLVTVAAPAADDKLSGVPMAVENPFVSRVSADLQTRFPTPESARRAGYVRYTDEDNTGAISYANRQWTSIDEAHPSQLWYDVNGRLLGADFSILQADSAAAPQKFGVDPRRWSKFPAHVHFGLVGPNGTTRYGGAGAKSYEKLQGANFQRPDASDFVKAGVVKSVKEVRFAFFFPAIWDLQIWVLPNANGAFADLNPDVKPVKGGGSS
jgi:hypothetical protein